MEALRLKATASDGKLSIAVPESFNNQELEVIVLLQPRDGADEHQSDIYSKRMELFGKAPFFDFPTNTYDVYNQ